MSALTFDDWQNRQEDNVVKALKGAAILAPYSAEAITAVTTGAESGLIELPAGYAPLGWLDSSGVAIATAITSSDITAWGSVYPIRSDVTKRATTIKVIAQETNVHTFSLYIGKDSSTVTPDVMTGEIFEELPLVPSNLNYRLIIIGVDTRDNDELYVGKFFPRVKVSNLDDQTFADGDAPLLYGVTFEALPDSVVGYAEAQFIAGPAAVTLAESMGFASGS